MQNCEYIYDNNSTVDNCNFQTFYTPSMENNYSTTIDPQFMAISDRNSRCIYYEEQEGIKGNYYYPNQSSCYYSQPSNLYNQWMENNTFENVKNKSTLENKDFYCYNIPATSPTSPPSLIETSNIETVNESYHSNFYSTNQKIQLNFQQNISLSSNELSLKSTPSPLNEDNAKLETVSSHPGMLYFMPTLIRTSKKERKNNTPKSSKERISKKPSMHVNSSCITCGTTETTLWRRDINGFPECNPCNLYFRTHQTKRPSRLFKNGKILKRNGKNKHIKNGFMSLPVDHENGKEIIKLCRSANTKNIEWKNSFVNYHSNGTMAIGENNGTNEYINNYQRNGISESHFIV
uniref:GATA-type domain-containing protein n=1 Tax=Strongyloides papillosus TaxID=174720 RepID=A0A0N5BSK7_STREA